MLDCLVGGNMNRGGEHVIRGLGSVHMVIGVNFAALKASGQGSDDLVGVHIRGSPRASLENINRELVIMFTSDNLFRAFHNGIAGFGIDYP